MLNLKDLVEVPAIALDREGRPHDLQRMTLPWTIAWLVASLSLLAFGIWRDRRPLTLTSVPLTPAMLWLSLGIVGIVLGLAHLLSLLTGVELHGRGPY